MNLHLILGHDLLIDEEISHCLSLIASQLQDLTPGIVINDCSITTTCLLEVLHDFLHIQLRWQALNQSQRFLALTLLNANVNFTDLGLLRSLRYSIEVGVSNWVEVLRILLRHLRN